MKALDQNNVLGLLDVICIIKDYSQLNTTDNTDNLSLLKSF